MLYLWTKVDVRKAYYQCPLIENAKPLTAFTTTFGLFQFTLMPFSLRNAPATFQRLMSQIIEGVTNCARYLDDLSLCNSVWSKHLENIREFFFRLKDAGLNS